MTALADEAEASPDTPRRAVALRLAVVARQMLQRFDQSVEGLGVSRAKFGVIAVVARRPGATQRLIAEALEVSEVTTGRLIERLCADGFLQRRENPSDRRAHSVHLTAASQPLLDRLAELSSVQETEAFAGFDDGDVATLGRLLEAMGRNIAAARTKRPSTAFDEGDWLEAARFDDVATIGRAALGETALGETAIDGAATDGPG